MPLSHQISEKPSSSEPTGSGLTKVLQTISSSKVGKQIEKSGMTEVPEDELPNCSSTMKKANEGKDLDLVIKPEDSRYFPTLCAIASKIAYKNKPFIEDVVQKQWKMKLLEAKDFWNARMEVPNHELPKYLSTMKKASQREDLDLLIKPEDSRYFPTFCASASKIAYKNKPFIEDVVQKQWKMKLLEAKDFWNARMEVPDHELPKYLSTMKKANEREDLDLLIKPEDSRYFPTLCAIASKIAYKNKPFIEDVVQKQWKMKLLEAKDFWNEYQQKFSTKAFMLHDQTANHDMIVVAFRGTKTSDVDAWSTDIDVLECKFGEDTAGVHSGFMKALGLQKDGKWPKNVERDDNCPLAYYTIREKLTEFFQKHPQTKFILTGHSLGGALAILFSAVLVLHEESDILKRLEAVYTFGQPRVGNKKFGEFLEGKFKEYGIVRYFRFVLSDDAIPRLPPDNCSFVFNHFGPWLYYETNYEGKKLDIDPRRDYYSAGLKHFEFLRLIYRGVKNHRIREYINAIKNGNTDILQ